MDNRVSRARLNALEKDKSFSMHEVVDALVDGIDLLTARVDALESQLDEFAGIIHSSLSPTEAIERLRHLRAEMP